ncbi:MAG: acyl carrier protein [Lachnospiraceae bacterium]|jgi:acyl carrier protein|nr:acyl carrier protein [uncultured Oribacterium sp.]MBF0982994.1 acyl carrier protein [Lachnospiraceae bacterium]
MELEKLKQIICRELSNVKEEEITEDSRFVEDLNADSLDIVQIVMGIEDEFGIEIPEEASYQIKTVGEAHQAILKALGK